MSWNPKFDLDLKFGQAGEQWLKMLGTPGGMKIEVKTERDQWAKTGNIVFEYWCRGKASGISTTESDFWVQLLSKDGSVVGMYGWPTVQLKAFLRKAIKTPSDYKARIVDGGDDKASRMLVIPISELHHIAKTELPI
jgi:hypothetical protein